METDQEAHHVLLRTACAQHGACKWVGVYIGRMHLVRFSGRNGEPLECFIGTGREAHAADCFCRVHVACRIQAGVEVHWPWHTLGMHQCGEEEPLQLETKDHRTARQGDKCQQGSET